MMYDTAGPLEEWREDWLVRLHSLVWNLFSTLEKEGREIAAWVRFMVVFFCDDDDGLFRETNHSNMMSRVLQEVQSWQCAVVFQFPADVNSHKGDPVRENVLDRITINRICWKESSLKSKLLDKTSPGYDWLSGLQVHIASSYPIFHPPVSPSPSPQSCSQLIRSPACTGLVMDLVLGLVELHEVHMGPLLKHVKVRLDDIAFPLAYQLHDSACFQLGTEGTLNPTVYVMDEDIK
ncbi:hypothetical protein QYF61_012070 [Mycteria americana]|uniref:Uncharacterized protein n=1 Tax=Mycteria americana TaxID=33587 RepID=A0AAN7P4Z6_MYCAM|nr:hypothetical protein QYF61_012070 [Mycteria americana]